MTDKRRLVDRLKHMSFRRTSMSKGASGEGLSPEDPGAKGGKGDKKKGGKKVKAKPTHVLSVHVSTLSALKGLKRGDKLRLSLKIGDKSERAQIDYAPGGAWCEGVPAGGGGYGKGLLGCLCPCVLYSGVVAHAGFSCRVVGWVGVGS